MVVDHLTKYSHFVPLGHPYTTKSVAQLFVKHVFKLHGLPQSNVSDRDSTFTSNFWRELFKAQGAKLEFSMAYHQQTDGQSEAVNKSLETYLRCFVGDWPKDWVRWVPLAEWWYNTTQHTSTRLTPFEALYGYQHPKLISYVPGTTKAEEVEIERHNINRAQE